MLTLQLLFAGAVKYIEHWGLFGGIAAVCILLAIFSNAIPFIGPYLHAIRKDLIWAAIGCGLIMWGMIIGGKDAENRCVAKTIIIEKTVTKAVKKTKTPAAKRQKDKWDRADN